MKPIPEPVYPCNHCSEKYSWPASDLNWSEIDEAWICDLCWGDIDVEQKGVCLADEINKAQAKHDAEVIQGAIDAINGYMTVSQAPHSQYAKGWNEAVKRIEQYQNQLRQKAQEAE